MDRVPPAMLRLVVCLDATDLADRALEAACARAERLGATAVLLGPAGVPARDLAQQARALVGRLSTPVLLAGRADVAVAAGAAGALLAPEDVPAPMIRRIAPRNFLVGAVVGGTQDVANGRGADFWAVGPWSQPGGRPMGPEGFSELLRRAEGRPCIAHGASVEDLPKVLAAGGVGVLLVKSEK